MENNESDSWRELSDMELMSGGISFKKELEKRNVSNVLADEIVSQLLETRDEKNNLIFLFTDGDLAVTAIHVPDESLNGEDGPMLMRGANSKSVIAAFSQSYIRKKVKIVDELEIITGLKKSEADKAWVEELETMATAIMVKMKENPPEAWEELLN